MDATHYALEEEAPRDTEVLIAKAEHIQMQLSGIAQMLKWIYYSLWAIAIILLIKL